MPAAAKKRQRENSGESTLGELVKSLAINDESWRCSVTMLVEEGRGEFGAVLSRVCAHGYRRAICAISREAMFARLARVDAADGVERSPAHQKILQNLEKTAATIYDSGDALPASLEALLIKWMIYETRLEHQARNRAAEEMALEREREFLAMQQQQQQKRGSEKQTRGKVNRNKQKEATKSESQPRVGSARKPSSKLRKRGEEWKDVVYVDDAPLDGPDLYVLLAGFRDDALPRELINAGVPLHCVLRLDGGSDAGEESASSGSACFEVSSASSPLTSSKSSRSSRSTCTTSTNRSTFWSDLDESSCCCDLLIRRYCPAAWSSADDALYDSVSYMLYDVHDAQRAHADYLASMRVLEMHEERPPRQELGLYEELVGAVPEQAACLVLEALLRQVELNLSGADDDEQTHQENDVVDDEEDAKQQPTRSDTISSSRSVTTTSSLTKVNSTGPESTDARARLTDKLRLLNLRYELIPAGEEEEEEEEAATSRLGLILHGDSLRLSACKADRYEEDEQLGKYSREVEEFRRRGAALFREPKITRAWDTRRQDEVDDCALHLPGILRHAEKAGLEPPRARHLLNLLGFRRILEARGVQLGCLSTDEPRNDDDAAARERADESVDSASERDEEIQLEDCICGQPATPDDSSHQQRGGSSGQPTRRSLDDSPIEPSSNAATARLDSPSRRRATVDTAELLRRFESSPRLFGLLDPRETLGLQLATAGTALDEFQDVELLGEGNFWQIVDGCFRGYEAHAVEYFAPTDSLLVAFYDEPRQPGEVSAERSVTCALRTPVCLRDFHEYVAEEEREWLDARRGSDGLFERCRSRMTSVGGGGDGDEGMVFRDADFVLPGSLKACELEAIEEEDEGEEVVENDGKAAAAKSQKASTSKEKKPRHRPSSVSSASTLETRPPFDFIGYDLGRRRVQVCNLRRVYEASDGTRLLLTREIWLRAGGDDGKKSESRSTYGASVEKVAERAGWSFACHEAADESCREFRLTTSEGIVVAFSRERGGSASNSAFPRKSLYDLQISRPSGLLVKPVDYPHNAARRYPFYILQRYATTTTTAGETRRKYLHNGDVVKFYGDGSAVVLRANGTVISVPPSAGAGGSERSESECEDSCGVSTETASVIRESESSDAEEEPPPRVTARRRYTVLELSGRRYEINVDDGRRRELDPVRASLAEEYSGAEKFLRRADGLEALFNCEGELVVQFTDGTRTLMGCRIEDKPARCDWSAAELALHFATSESPEGFVSVIAYSRAEHPSYAAVFANCGSSSGSGGEEEAEADREGEETTAAAATDATSIGLSMGGGLRLELMPGAIGKILYDDDRLRVELGESGVTVERRERRCDCDDDEDVTSRATFRLVDSSSGAAAAPKELLTFRDDATCLTLLRSAINSCHRLHVTTSSSDALEKKATCRCDERQGNDCSRRLRLFALSAGGEACEYRRASEWRELLDEMLEDEGASLVQRPSGGERTSRLAITTAKDWSMDYEVSNASVG